MRPIRFMLVLVGGLIWSGACPGEQPPAPDSPVILAIQQDLNPDISRLGLKPGLKWQFGQLPPDRPVSVVLLRLDGYETVLQGPAAKLPGQLDALVITAKTQNSQPLEMLGKFLADQPIRHQTVFVITNGRSQTMMHQMQLSHLNFAEKELVGPDGLNQHPSRILIRGFDPQKYPPLLALRQTCRDQDIRLVGLYVVDSLVYSSQPSGGNFFQDDAGYVQRRINTRDLAQDVLGFTALRWLDQESKGDTFYDFTQFQGLFGSLQARGFFD